VSTSSDPELCLAPKQAGASKACPAENPVLSSTGHQISAQQGTQLRPKSEAIGDSGVRLHALQAFLVSHPDATGVALRPAPAGTTVAGLQQNSRPLFKLFHKLYITRVVILNAIVAFKH
jgi:hypothetical protein